MKKFKFFLIKTVRTPRFKQINKTIVLKAIDSTGAQTMIACTYPDWEISMFWECV